MRIIRAADCRRMPWKNGGGETVEIATEPAGAGLDDFEWRLSTARVARDGPFSAFPGVDRTLALVGGGALHLTHDGTSVLLDANSAPYRFDADVPAEGALPDGAVTDLNMMTRRGRADHRMRRIAIEGATNVPCTGAPSLLFCAAGEIDVGADRLAVGDCAVLSGPIVADGQGIALLVEIYSEAIG